MQGTRVRALVREDPTCRGAAKPVHHNYWACKPQLLSPRATTTEARVPRAHAPQQEKPPHWEARALQRRPNTAKNKLKKKKKKNSAERIESCLIQLKRNNFGVRSISGGTSAFLLFSLCDAGQAFNPLSLSFRVFIFYLFIYFLILTFYFCLRWVSAAARGLSLVVASGGYSLLQCVGFSLQWLLLLRSTGSRCTGFSSCGMRAQ